MSNILSQKFTTWTLLKFTAPTIIMMVFMSLYTMVDGVFVSNLIGENALSAVNMVYPIQSIIIAIAIMFATGGSAVIAKKMGEGNSQEAKRNFSLIIAVSIGIGIVVLMLGLLFIEPIITLLGATEALYNYCYDYLSILILFTPLAMLQMLFQFLFVTAGKPNYGLVATVAGGVANIVLDYVFMYSFGMGIAGAALATGIGYSIPAIFGLLYFAFNKTGVLCFTKFKFDMKVLLQACMNGSSEMVTNLATAVTTFLFNIIMIRYLGENGVAAVTIVLYAQFLLTAVYLGFSSGVAPVFSYNYGEENTQELKKIFKISMLFITISSVVIFILSIVFTPNIVSIFVKEQSEVFPIAINGFLLFSIGYLFTGFNIFASAMFTAFSNGKISAIISFARTFIFIILGIIFLPKFMGVSGIWLAVPFAEIVTLVLSFFFIVKLKKFYQYL